MKIDRVPVVTVQDVIDYHTEQDAKPAKRLVYSPVRLEWWEEVIEGKRPRIEYPLVYCYFLIVNALINWIGAGIGIWKLDRNWTLYAVKPLVGWIIWLVWQWYRKKRAAA